MAFSRIQALTDAEDVDVNQIFEALEGDAGKGQPISLTALNDPVRFALAARNLDPTNSRALQVLKADGTDLLIADANGVFVDRVTINQIATPPAPGVGKTIFYTKADGQVYSRSGSAGTEARLVRAPIVTTDIAADAVTQSEFKTGVTANPTTTSTVYVDMPDMEVTLTTVGGDLLVWFVAALAHSTVGNYIQFSARLDAGVEPGAMLIHQNVATHHQTAALVWRFRPVAAGAHVVRIRWLTNAGTATAYSSQRYLLVQEAKR